MCLCSTLLALSCGQIFKLLCLLWFLQFTRLAAHLFSPEGGNQVCGFFPAHQQNLFWVGSWSSRARSHGHTAEQAQGASSRVGGRCGLNTWCIGSAHTPGRETPRVVPPGVLEWTSYWAHVFDTIWNSYLPLSQYPSFPQSWSSHLSTPDAGREKQVFSAVFHLARVAGCLCQKNQPLEVFPWGEGWCWESLLPPRLQASSYFSFSPTVCQSLPSGRQDFCKFCVWVPAQGSTHLIFALQQWEGSRQFCWLHWFLAYTEVCLSLTSCSGGWVFSWVSQKTHQSTFVHV